jgi:hypothetical protein
MDIEKAQELFDEIVDICYELDNPKLKELVDSLYSEVMNSSEISRIRTSMEEIQVFLNENEFLPDEEDSVASIEKKIEKLSE